MIAARRLLAALLTVGGLAGVGAVGVRHHAPAVTPVFAELGQPTMPFVPALGFVSSAWFCAGVPIGATDLGGAVVVANPTDVAIAGELTVFTDAAGVGPLVTPIDVAARASASFDLTTIQPQGSFLSAMVEIRGGGGFVEQRAVSPSGAAVSPCSNSTSSNWYFADGFTMDDTSEQLVITNPFPDQAIVTITEVTRTESRTPARLESLPIEPRSVLVISQELLAKREVVLAIHVQAVRGRVVVGRAQNYRGSSGRVGFTMTLGAPALSGQYFFADGESAPDIIERYSFYNPGDQDVSVTVLFEGLVSPDFTNDTVVNVPAHRAAILVTSDVPNLPQGRHGVLFGSELGEPFVVERAITRPAGDGRATTVVMGAPGESASTRWSMAIGTDLIPLENALVVLNVDGLDGTVTVKSLGAGGLVAVPGLESVALPASGLITISLTDQAVLDRPLVLESTTRIFVERLLPRDPDLRGRSGSFALPG